MNMRKVFGNKVPTAGVNITDQINLYINLEFFKELTLEQRIDLLLHECHHLINGHITRAEKQNLPQSDMKLWNIACLYLCDIFLRLVSLSNKCFFL